jgi:hypothetical protein
VIARLSSGQTLRARGRPKVAAALNTTRSSHAVMPTSAAASLIAAALLTAMIAARGTWEAEDDLGMQALQDAAAAASGGL